jgi:hypothetical protein
MIGTSGRTMTGTSPHITLWEAREILLGSRHHEVVIKPGLGAFPVIKYCPMIFDMSPPSKKLACPSPCLNARTACSSSSFIPTAHGKPVRGSAVLLVSNIVGFVLRSSFSGGFLKGTGQPRQAS